MFHGCWYDAVASIGAAAVQAIGRQIDKDPRDMDPRDKHRGWWVGLCAAVHGQAQSKGKAACCLPSRCWTEDRSGSIVPRHVTASD